MKYSGYKKLGRDSQHRRATLRSLATALLRHETIKTTLPRARALAPFVEKLLTKAKAGGLTNRRALLRDINDREVVEKVFDALVPRFAARPGGYTRVFHLGPRVSDGAKMSVVKLSD